MKEPGSVRTYPQETSEVDQLQMFLRLLEGGSIRGG